LEVLLPGSGVNLDNHHPLRLKVGFILHQSVGFSRNFDFDLPSLAFGGDLAAGSLKGSVRLTRTAQGLYAKGTLQASTRVECVRCLTEFDHLLTAEVNDLFTYPPDPGADPLLVIPETGVLDLTPLVREVLLLDLPMQPLCRPDCQGLCPECGGNRNLSPCEHPEAEIDPRLAALKSLL
jgi:uncharacterized protein